jgi:hypothetical protein
MFKYRPTLIISRCISPPTLKRSTGEATIYSEEWDMCEGTAIIFNIPPSIFFILASKGHTQTYRYEVCKLNLSPDSKAIADLEIEYIYEVPCSFLEVLTNTCTPNAQTKSSY